MELSSELAELSLEQLRELAWYQGDLNYKLHEGQRDLDEAWESTSSKVFPICSSVRWGKSYWCFKKCVEKCLQRPHQYWLYGAATQKAVEQILDQIGATFFDDCPEELLPKLVQSKGIYEFRHNGSKLFCVGLDGRGAERIRGLTLHGAVIDEAGAVDIPTGEGLEYAIESVIKQRMLTTGGRVLMISTPSRFPEHLFNTRYVAQAEARGELVRKTIWDAPHIPHEAKLEAIESAGGPTSAECRREYFAEVVPDEERSVLPEFDRCFDEVVQPVVRPQHFEPITCIDFGYHDLTACIFGFHDFENGLLCIEDELYFRRQNSGHVAEQVKQRELALWGHPPERRIGDCWAQQRADLAKDHEFVVDLPIKDDKQTNVNVLRLAIEGRRGQLRIDPKCERTISHFRGAVWKTPGRDFERSGSDMGHFDGVDVACYFVRAVNRRKNPFPAPSINYEIAWQRPPHSKSEERRQKLQGLFRRQI